MRLQPYHPRPDIRGMRHPAAKLTDDQVRSIRARLEAGERPGALAREFGVSAENIRVIQRRWSWAWLT